MAVTDGVGMDWYPDGLAVDSSGTPGTYNFMAEVFERDRHLRYAEFGFYRGATAFNVAQRFPNAELFLFDYSKAVELVAPTFSQLPNRVHFWPSSERYLDSYNWSLMKIIQRQEGVPLFDYCFLDGAHTFAIDALTFFLADRLLNVGGYMDFDDYHWSLRGSSLDPSRVPETDLMYTPEQIDAHQVALIVDEIVRRDPRYMEVVPKKVFKKVAP